MGMEHSALFGSTSRIAGETAAKSIGRRRRQILALLAEHPEGMTIFEIAELLGCLDHQISGRFRAMEADELIEKTGERRVKPATGCPCEVYRLAEHLPPAPTLADRLGIPATLTIDGELFERGSIDDRTGDDLPGIPYMRRAGGSVGGARMHWRVEMIECPGCGKPLKMIVERRGQEQIKVYRCGDKLCGRSWRLMLVQEPGRAEQPALVMTHL